MSSTTPVSAVMTSKVVTVRPDQSLAEAADVLAEHGIGAAPVVDDAGIDRRTAPAPGPADLRIPSPPADGHRTPPRHRHHAARRSAPLRRRAPARVSVPTVEGVMERKFVSLAPDASLEDLATVMHESDVTHVPIVDAGVVVGIAARGDIVRHLADARDRGAHDGNASGRCGWRSTSMPCGRTPGRSVPRQAPARGHGGRQGRWGTGTAPYRVHAERSTRAEWIGVALAEEGITLRVLGIDAPIWCCRSPRPTRRARRGRRADTSRSTPWPEWSSSRKRWPRATGPLRFRCTSKIDTGMHRVGCTPGDARTMVDAIAERSELLLSGVCTHLAIADEPDYSYTAEQLARFDALLAELARRASMSGCATRRTPLVSVFPVSNYDLVRTGIVIYGIAPVAVLADRIPLHPALSFKARVSYVKTVPAGARLSYGLRYEVSCSLWIATVPVEMPTACPATWRAVGVRSSSVGAGFRSPGRSRWTRSSSTSATPRSRSATKWCSSATRARPR